MIKYNSLSEWNKNEPNAYKAAVRLFLIDKICDKFGWEKTPYKEIKPNGYWTKENILAEAKKYNTPREWKKGSSTSYSTSFKFGWFEESTAHMDVFKRKPSGYWDIKENVLNDAKKHNTKSKWGTGKNANLAAYNSAKKNGWFEEATAHMVEICKPVGYWTLELCMESALKYITVAEWHKKEGGAYAAAKKNGWFEECSKHMLYLTQHKGHWNIKKNVLDEAKKYNSRSEFSKKSSGAYNSSITNGWHKESTAHMKEFIRPSGYWTKETVLAEAKKYKTNTEWVKKSRKSHIAAQRNDWLDECRQHMDDSIKLPGYWNIKENVLAEAKKYQSRTEWLKTKNGSTKAANRHGWYEEACAHMTFKIKPVGYWTKENVLAEAKKYKSKKEWRKFSSNSLKTAQINKWLDECTKHMVLFKNKV